MQEDSIKPAITVVISTRDRGDEIVAAINSILHNDYPLFDLRVVDQSADDRTEQAVRPFRDNPRFIYTRSSTVGVSAGRNIAICTSPNELLALTDDDCEVPVGWLSNIVKAFEINPRVGLVFGNVLEGHHDMKEGFIPSYKRKEPFLARSVKDKNRTRGIGACMGLRKSAWKAVHGFDEMLGPGSKLKCAEDFDLTIKVLLAGYYVYETPAISLLHNGFRSWFEGKELAKRNYYGIGAMLAKNIKHKPFLVIRVFAYEVADVIRHQLIKNSIAHRNISGVTPIVYLFKGLWKGLLTPLESDTGNFREKRNLPGEA